MRSTGIRAITVAEDDKLAWVAVSSGDDDIILATAMGRIARFAEEEVRPMGRDAAGVIDLAAPVTENLHAIAKAKGEKVRDLTAVILDRDRHHDLIAQVRETGCRIRLIPDGDVAGVVPICR